MYYIRKAQGICVNCGKEKAVPGKVCCQKCADKHSTYQRESRALFKSLGLCPRCGKNKLFGDEKECPECVAKMYETNVRSKTKKYGNYKKFSKEYYKKDIARLTEQNLCRGCRKRQRAVGHTYCEICLAKKRAESREIRNRTKNNGISRSERPNYGLCYTCGGKLDRNGRVCAKCASKMTKNLPKKGDNKIWREDNRILGVY